MFYLFRQKGVFVWLTQSLVAHVMKKDLCDGFVEDIEESFPVGKRVKGNCSAVARKNAIPSSSSSGFLSILTVSHPRKSASLNRICAVTTVTNTPIS